jgi:uncharacterized membrane protein
MMESFVLLRNTLLAVHFLAATAWVGGMFYALMVLRPSLGLLDANPRMQVHLQTLRRFFLVVWHAMPLMLLTGWAMIFLAWGGFAHLPLSINLMQAGGILMALIFLYAFFDPYRRLRRAIRPTPEMVDGIRSLILANLVIGVLVIVAGSLGHTW